MPDARDVSLRPLEAVIVRLANSGSSPAEIGLKVGRKPGTVSRIQQMIEYKQDMPEQETSDEDLPKPLERVIENLRSQGENYGEIGRRLGRSGAFIRRVEHLRTLRP